MTAFQIYLVRFGETLENVRSFLATTDTVAIAQAREFAGNDHFELRQRGRLIAQQPPIDPDNR